ncbi:MAG: plasmid pRiA4b ORF-3 family protein [Actinomycetota bacterium]|nr:plasmid pRiA4b ORF-3 family protein [Actinomycetota bacterium]
MTGVYRHGPSGAGNDFGASWIHEIALQKKAPREPGADYPFCVRYSGNSPVEYPEEGIWYSDDGEPVEAGPAKPEPLDLAAVNRRLGALEADLPRNAPACGLARQWNWNPLG